MIREYAEGKTPNPDVMCNREIKFDLFLEKAKELRIDYIATGHYARLDHDGPHSVLSEALDKSKDQSYFLWAVEPRQLGRCLFHHRPAPWSRHRREGSLLRGGKKTRRQRFDRR